MGRPSLGAKRVATERRLERRLRGLGGHQFHSEEGSLGCRNIAITLRISSLADFMRVLDILIPIVLIVLWLMPISALKKIWLLFKGEIKDN